MTDAAWLAALLERFGAIAGTVHRRQAAGLELTAAIHIPEPVQAATRIIPAGKGMAGLAWSRGVPVQTCDLRADETGDVQPGARAVEAGAAIAVPVILAGSSAVRAVVGLAFASTDPLPESTISAITEAAKGLPA